MRRFLPMRREEILCVESSVLQKLLNRVLKMDSPNAGSMVNVYSHLCYSFFCRAAPTHNADAGLCRN